MLFFSILFSLIVACAYSEIYNKENATNLFDYYKMKYNKNYENETQNLRGFENFINNLNKVTALNEKSSDNATLYIVNMYADVDTEEIKERFGISLKPYVNAKNPKETNILRHDSGKYIDDTFLYDLYETDELYKKFMAKYNKPIAKKERDRTARYYRFLKTLIEINNNNFEGHEMRMIEADADVVKEPHNIFY